MNVYLTRDSVCAADDVDAPHKVRVSLPDDCALEEIIVTVSHSANLPRIAYGKATWIISSNLPIAVIAQQWEIPKPVQCIPPKLGELDLHENTLKIHLSYLAQIDPDTVMNILQRIRLKAPS